MEIILNDPELVPDLLSYLEEEGFVAVEGDHGTVNASPAPGSFREDHVRMELELRLAVWRSRHPDVSTDLTLSS